MKIIVLMGSPRSGETQKAVKHVSQRLKELGGFDIEIINLKDTDIKPCMGCFTCLTGKGEEKCPLKDDRDLIFGKLKSADGLIIAVPNYSLQVPALTKNLLDRLAFIFHRPCMYGKRFMALVTQGIYGGGGIIKYLNEAMKFWGFGISKGVCVTTPPGQRLLSQQKKIDRALDRAAERFARELAGRKQPKPSFKDIVIFRLARTGLKNTEETSIDRLYYESKGWFKSRYYYDVRLGPFKLTVGWLMDRLAAKMADKNRREAARHIN